MLSPSINMADNLLVSAFNEIIRLDAYAAESVGTMIGVLPKDPAWLASVRNRLAMLAKAGAAWTSDKPDIWAPLLVQFTDYASLFASVSDQQGRGLIKDRDAWIALFQGGLLPQLERCMTTTAAAGEALRTHYNAFRNIQPLLEDSIDQGWEELAAEEQQMVKIAQALTHLQDVADSLEDSITAADLTTGKTVVQTTVTTLYNIAVEAGTSFSFIGMAASAFTVGKFYYDLIQKTAEIADALRKIADLQVQASEEAQAAAGTKLVLRLLYRFELSFGRIVDVVPQIATLWQQERDKVKSVIAALNAGVDPSLYFELQTISVANANWQAISRFAQALPTMKSTVGPAVTFDPQHPTAAVG